MNNNNYKPENSLGRDESKVSNLNITYPKFDTSLNEMDTQKDSEMQNRTRNGSYISDNLKTVLATREKLKKIKANEINFSEPVLKQGGNAVIFPHTINVIQGQAGVHKSRLAENICAAFLKLNGSRNELLGFNRHNISETHTIVYVDTERNLSEQLPYSLQSIQMKAGYNLTDHPSNFEYISLLQISRKERFTTLNEYLNYLKESVNNPLFIVLDVSTDCIEDFNKTDKSMELIDLMNMAINEHNVIFLCIIHENPKSDKARGHFGTELMNKSSTVMQVGFEKDANQNDTDIIRVKYLKCRSTARYPPFHIKYCNEAKGLILADVSDVTSVINSRKLKARNEDIIEFIEMHLGDGSILTRVELLDKLCTDFKASQRTIETRISDIINLAIGLSNDKGENCLLSKEIKEKIVYYKLIPNKAY